MLRIFKNAFLALALSSLIVSCGNNNSGQTIDKEKSGGKISLNLTSSPNFFPLEATDIFSIRFVSQIYEGLVKVNPYSLEIEPAVAESWEISPDGKEYTFKLRENIFFHDNESTGKNRKVTIEDVEYCIRKSCAIAPNNGYSDFLKDKLVGGEAFLKASENGELPSSHEGIEIIDSKTLKLKLVSSNSAILNMLAFCAYGIYPADMTTHDKVFVGTGPFQVSSIEGSVISLKRNENYWMKDENGNQLPYLEEVVFHVSEDRMKEVEDFKNNELDLIIELQSELMDNLLPDLDKIKKGESIDYGYDNTSTLSVFSVYFNHEREFFKDVRVRKAISMAIDRKKIVDSILLGDGDPALYGYLPPFDKMEREKRENLDFNPTKAKQLLTEAGYPNGLNAPEIQLVSTNDQRNINLLTSVGEMIFTNLNIKVDIDTFSFVDLINESEKGSFDMWRFSWIADYPDPENFLSMFLSNANKRLNTPKYKSERYDEAFKKAVAEKDLSKRMDLFKQVDDILIEEAVIAPIYHSERSLIFHKRIQKLSVNPLDILDFTKVYISKEQQ